MWSASIFKTNLQIEMIVEHVDLMATLNIDTRTNATTLGDFVLNEIGYYLSWLSKVWTIFNEINFFNYSNVKITIGGIPGGGSDVISKRISLLSNLVKDSLIYAFQEALRPFVAKAIKAPVFHGLLVEPLLKSSEMK